MAAHLCLQPPRIARHPFGFCFSGIIYFQYPYYHLLHSFQAPSVASKPIGNILIVLARTEELPPGSRTTVLAHGDERCL